MYIMEQFTKMALPGTKIFHLVLASPGNNIMVSYISKTMIFLNDVKFV